MASRSVRRRLALGVSFYLLPGRQSTGPLSIVVLVVVVAVRSALLRPFLLGLAVLKLREPGERFAAAPQGFAAHVVAPGDSVQL
jgi:hypothetical protein